MCGNYVVRGMTDDGHSDGPPPFDRPFEGDDPKKRVCGVVLHARDPMTASEIAERADCSEESARTHLSFYADLGIVIRHDGRTVRYERHDDYFEWRRVNRLSQENTVDELQVRVAELTDQIKQYREKFGGVDSPADVNVLEFDAEDIDDVYVELGNWATVIEDRLLHERARRKAAGYTASPHG